MRVPRSDGLLPDRYVEVDLDWFRPGDPGSVDEFVERVVPLWSGNRPERGVVLNPGFLVDVVTEFSGDVGQCLPLRSRRYERWGRHTYADLRDLAVGLKRSAVRFGIGDLRVGILVAGVGRVITGSDIYDLESDWCDRHPELYPFDLSPLPGPDLDPRVPLVADDHRYAAFPDGIAGGMAFGDLLAAQWAAVASACELDVIHLRDGFWGPMLYTRRGPYGVVASADAEQNESWTTSVRDLFAAVKQARPESTVMAYTSGIGATAEWRSGCVDTEAVLSGGGVDILIDQTWGGAWQDWWDDWWKGWTNQHVNLLSHGVAVRGCGQSVRHYKLIETWDGWEPFDTVHAVPEKLRWAMWAWSHAAIVTPDGLEVPDGTYVSWMNDRDLRLLDAEAVGFVADELGRAEDDAAEMTAVGGPIVVFDRERVASIRRDDPRGNAGEHIEDAVALAMKWGLPTLGATRAEWLESIDPASVEQGLVVQLGSPSLSAIPATTPMLLVGRADAVDQAELRRAGCDVNTPPRRSGYHREHLADPDLPAHGWVHLSGDAGVHAADDADVLARAGERPTLVASGARAWWQPPELADPGNPLLPRSQYGSVASAAAVARWWATVAADVRVAVVPFHEPVAVQWWRRGDTHRLLAGNLEAGWVGDARVPRHVGIETTDQSGATTRIDLDVPREGCIVTDISPLVGATAGVAP